MIQVILLFLVASSTLSCDPQPVKNLSVTKVTSFQIQVGWSLPSAEDLKCLWGYKFCWKEEDHRAKCTTVQIPSLSEYTFIGLESCQTHNLSVAAIGDNGTTSANVSVSARTAPEPETSLKVARKDNYTITASWWTVFSWRNFCVDRFRLSLCDALGSNCNNTIIRMLGSEYEVDLPMPPSCRTHTLDLVLIDDENQTSDVFRHILSPEVISVPANLTVTNVTSRSFSMSWGIEPSYLDCDYFVDSLTRCGVGSQRFARSTSHNKGQTSHMEWRQVKPCMECNFTVYFAVTNVIKSEGNPGNTSMKVYTLPEGDKIFEDAAVLEATSSSVTVAWKASLPASGQCIAAYSVCWEREDGGASRTVCRNIAVDQNNLQITGLAANTTYQFSLAAQLYSGVRFGEVELEATTSSGQARLLPNSLVGISTMIFVHVLYLTAR